MANARFFCQSSEEMNQVADDSISLTVTSPPYYNAIHYETHAVNPKTEYRGRYEKFGSYSDYMETMRRVFSEVLRVTKPGGFCGMVIGTILNNKKHIPLPFDMVPQMIRIGWLFHQDIIWHKTTAGIRRAGVAIQRPYPGYYYPNIMTEYILMFRKPGDPIYHTHAGDGERSRFEIDRLFKMDTANNVWHIAPVPPRSLNHPAPFPEEIPYRLIRLYSYEGDTVLDP